MQPIIICHQFPQEIDDLLAHQRNSFYSRENDSAKLFEELSISKELSYKAHLNQYNVIFLNMQSFLSRTHDILKMIEKRYRCSQNISGFYQKSAEGSKLCGIGLYDRNIAD